MLRNNLALNIDEDNIDDETSFDNTNEDSDRNDRFLYARILNTIPDIREKSNLKKYTFVAVILSLFLLTIFLFTFLETRNDNNNLEEIDIPEINNKTITESIIKNDLINTTSNIVMNNTTEINFTEKVFNSTENSTAIETDNFLITTSQLNLTKDCLKYDINSLDDVQTIQKSEACKINFGPILTKTKIRFVMGRSLLFLCLIHGQTCNYFYEIETNTHILTHGLKDIYFNFVLGSNGELYEGRSLSCIFDENFLSDDHSTILIIGMPNCEFLDEENDWERDKFRNTLKVLLECLQFNHILSNNYTMEFDMSCKNFLEVEDIFKLYHDRIILTTDETLHIDKYLRNRISN